MRSRSTSMACTAWVMSYRIKGLGIQMLALRQKRGSIRSRRSIDLGFQTGSVAGSVCSSMRHSAIGKCGTLGCHRNVFLGETSRRHRARVRRRMRLSTLASHGSTRCMPSSREWGERFSCNDWARLSLPLPAEPLGSAVLGQGADARLYVIGTRDVSGSSCVSTDCWSLPIQ